jgi:hypothetical protein
LNEFGSNKINLRTVTCSSTGYAITPFSLPLMPTLASGLASLKKGGVSWPDRRVVEWSTISWHGPSMLINVREEDCWFPSSVATLRLIAVVCGEGQGLLEEDDDDCQLIV